MAAAAGQAAGARAAWVLVREVGLEGQGDPVVQEVQEVLGGPGVPLLGDQEGPKGRRDQRDPKAQMAHQADSAD